MSVKKIGTEQEFVSLLTNNGEEYEQDFIVVLDLYQNWCGPCTVMESTFSRLVLNYEDLQENIAIVSASVEDMKIWMDSERKKSEEKEDENFIQANNSNPISANERNQSLLPSLSSIISCPKTKKELNTLLDKEKSCEPCFLYITIAPKTSEIRHKISLRAIVHGADAPKVGETLRECLVPLRMS